jgi:phosphate transporter
LVLHQFQSSCCGHAAQAQGSQAGINLHLWLCVVHFISVHPAVTIFLWLTNHVATHSRDVTASRTRRISISSTEENIDLEASLPPFRVPPGHSFPTPVPEREEPGPEASVSLNDPRNRGSLGRSRSPTVAVFGLANKLRSSIASLGSPHGPASGGSETIWTSKKNFATDTQLLFKRRITNLYVQVSALRSYVELNYSGFRKVLKKYVVSCPVDSIIDSAR